MSVCISRRLVTASSLIAAIVGTLVSTSGSAPANAAANGHVFANNIWAGYASVGIDKYRADMASVGASWRVPTASCQAGEVSRSATWVGLGGTEGGGSELEQIGTLTNCILGNPDYSAVYQMRGRPGWGNSRTVSHSVKPGDEMHAAVGYNLQGDGQGVYNLVISDSTQGWYFRDVEVGSTAVSAHNSAEWVVEAPTGHFGTDFVYSLTNFGTVSLASCTADGRTIDGKSTAGGTPTPNGWGYTELDLSKPSSLGNVVTNSHKAWPSPLGSDSDGSTFSVRWEE
jgi:hypothetical protein